MLAVRDLGEALRSARRRSQKWLAWQQLDVTDKHGVDRTTPYAVEPIATLEGAYALDEGDCDVIHHLAIAYHAMAWDLELCEPSKASAAWEKALFYWRKLQACGDFWQDLCTKGEALGEDFDRRAVARFRHDLIQYLLEIHVDFIRHYYGLKQYDQASRHIELVRRARIPPAARKELEALVYEAMTSTVPNTVAEGRFGDALAMLDGFLSLFPSHLPALQSYLETTKEWLGQMSPNTEWQEIRILDKRVLPRWTALNSGENLSGHPLAHAALGDLASVLGGKHWAKARSLRLQRKDAGQEPQTLACEEYEAYESAISWLKKVETHISNDPEVQHYLFNALMCRAEFLTEVGAKSHSADEVYELLAEALSNCLEAARVIPEDKSSSKFAASILNSRARYTLDSSDLDFSARLKKAEKDLMRAIQLDPENPVLQGNLDKIQDASEHI